MEEQTEVNTQHDMQDETADQVAGQQEKVEFDNVYGYVCNLFRKDGVSKSSHREKHAATDDNWQSYIET